MTNKNAVHVKKMVLTAIFAALSIIVGLFEIPWPPMPYLKIDFSEVVLLVSLLVIGLPRTVIVVILRSLVRELSVPKPFEPIPVVGEVMAILGSVVLILLYKAIFGKKNKNIDDSNLINIDKPDFAPKVLFKSSLVATGFAIFMTALNFFITLPIFLSGLEHFHFISFVNDPAYSEITTGTYMGYMMFVLTGFLPFNIVKGILTMIVFDLVKVGLSEMKYNEKTTSQFL